MRKQHLLPAFVLFLFTSISLVRAEDLKGWKTDGDVSLDSTRSQSGTGSSIKLAPGARAVKTLRAQDGSGDVSMWIYDDMTAPADSKAPRTGPCWGVIEPDGQMLIVGSLYASYLSGAEGYSAAAGKKDFDLDCQWTSVPRQPGWRKWDFNFDPDKGMTLQVDGKPVKFDWKKTSVAGFSGIVLLGDQGPAPGQTLWVDGVQSTLGGPMKIKPTLPPPSAPFLPEKDPAASGPPVQLLPAVAGQHPRLLLTPARIAQLRAFYNSDQAALYRQQLLSLLPECTVPANLKTSESWGQDIGLQKMPTVALHYVLTGDKDSFAKCMAYLHWLAGQPDWTEGGGPPGVPVATALTQLEKMAPQDERNSDTTASFTMVGAALTWDWLYNDMDPTFREQFRQVLWQHARVMYYGGHLAGNPGGGYWRAVPMYNHRWFRDWGLTLAALASTEGKPEDQWLLGKIESELQFMADWLPADGSNHEGPGYGSSSGALGMTFEVADGCLGTHHLDVPFFRNVAAYALQESAPGMEKAFYFSDCFTNAISLNPYFMKTAAVQHQADVLDGLRHDIRVNATKFGVRESAWVSLLSDDPTQQGGDYTKLPTTAFYPDLGLALLRENWSNQAVAAMFKCGPPGGYDLNSWRPTARTPDGQLPYINVAHDHPDANSFIIFDDGDYAAETDRYPEKPGKLSSSINTILINGIGQAPKGRPEGEAWLQPSNDDMTSMGVITAWKNAGDVVVTEGEASGAYLAYTDNLTKKTRPDLDRFRRSFIWVKGGYVLVLDDIRAPQPVEVTWLMQGAKLDPVDPAKGAYRLTKNASQCDFQVLSDRPIQSTIGVSTANDHSKLLGWQQLQASATVPAIRFVSLYDPWHHKDLKLTFTPAGPDKATVTVTGAGIDDTWNWQAAPGKFDSSTLHGSRKDGFDVLVNGQTAAPPKPVVGKLTSG